MLEERLSALAEALPKRFMPIPEVTECLLDLEGTLLITIVAIPDSMGREEVKPAMDRIADATQGIEDEFADTKLGILVLVRPVDDREEGMAAVRASHPFKIYQRAATTATAGPVA